MSCRCIRASRIPGDKEFDVELAAVLVRGARGREALFRDVELFEVRCCLACVLDCGAVLLSVKVLGGGRREGVGGVCRVVERVLWVLKCEVG